MIKKLATYAFGAIGLYLVVVNWTGFTKDVAQVGTSASGLVGTFQGR
jgi:hypothetical protein